MTTNPTPVLEARGLVKRFGANTALNGVDLTVQEGDVVAILGPSGSGKSTLVRCLHQLEQIHGGSMWLDGELLGYETHGDGLRPRRDRDIDRQRRKMGMVFQQFNLFPNMSVLRNITEAPVTVLGMSRDEAQERARELLEMVGLADKAGARPTQLSGGQQQRVAIARALAMRPQVLLLDEVTSALDPELVAGVLDVLRDIARTTDITMLCVTHEMNFARTVADTTVFMHQGKIWESGPSKELFANPQTPELSNFVKAGAH